MRMLILIAVAGSLSFGQNNLQKANTLYICKGGHPRCEVPYGQYGYPQFAEHKLKDFFAISEVFPPGAPEEHYQSFISEIVSQRANSNAVALWGDATAAVDNAVVWGGFLTARTGTYQGAVPNDAELIGLEVNVLNKMQPGVYPNKSKVGVRVVGFGNPGTAAFQVFPDQPGTPSGKFQEILAVHPGSITEDGTVFGIGKQQAKIGLNMGDSEFSDSAIVLSDQGHITFRSPDRTDARIYRDQFAGGHLVLRTAPAGLRITDTMDSRNLLYILPDGTIHASSQVLQHYAPMLVAGAGVICGLIVLNVYLWRTIKSLTGKIEAIEKKKLTQETDESPSDDEEADEDKWPKYSAEPAVAKVI